VTRFL